MDLIYSIEHRYLCTPDGLIWTKNTHPYSYWLRYLEVFDHVKVIARVQKVTKAPDNWIRADGENVSFCHIPYYVGPYQYLLKSISIKKTIRNLLYKSNDAVIMRVGSRLAYIMIPILKQKKQPYALEVVGDPYDVFSKGSVKHLFRPFFRYWATNELKKLCNKACAVAYVTENALQKRYPSNPQAFTTFYSSIDLKDKTILDNNRFYNHNIKSKNIIYVGSLSQLYKAPDVLIDAISICIKEGLDLTLNIVGDGKYRKELESQTNRLGLSERISFLGQLTAGKEVFEQLDKADLFILPSKTEGLPRAMIEAMARGLPCIGSNVGGIPELLPSEDMVAPGDVKALAHKIKEVVSSPDRMTKMSARNLEKAKEYREDILKERRNKFYQYVRQKTEEWLANK